ncbi:MAG: hypothetical protein COX40_03270 [Candidatus Omnitrophica bacterium CG23_combo_of_CG06-09_8_20_14_all_40_11]|nr:MAG: hypothetical protein COX40_03270 [Candidatus Omnitrophica bacterium CG23_combo_of_CG06-09_8_20_14_all_40_11]
MSYAAALEKGWEDLSNLNPGKILAVKFLGDEYSVDLQEKRALSLACNAPAKDFAIILILHYLAHKLKGLPSLTNEWMSFKELSGVEGYYSAFRKRAIEPIIRKYGSHPEGLLAALDRLSAKRVDQGDVGIVLEVFEGVPVLITLWRSDDEFGPEANMLFDKSITRIFCTEDIVVLAGFVASLL